MKVGLDVNNVNPFIQASINIFQSVVQLELNAGSPQLSDLVFDDTVFILQLGITGEMKGQVLIAMTTGKACEIASRMMCGMEVPELDEMARSALGELSNMIMGNTATLFSTLGVLIDITPPMSLQGSKLTLQADVEALKIPLLYEEEKVVDLYVCIENG